MVRPEGCEMDFQIKKMQLLSMQQMQDLQDGRVVKN
jgi:hypothetical protein